MEDLTADLNLPEFIICSAIYYDDNNKHENQPLNINSGFVITGRRHNNCRSSFKLLNIELYNKLTDNEVCGFLTSTNKFVNRKEGFKIAYEKKQIYHKIFDDNDVDISLTSEDLW